MMDNKELYDAIMEDLDASNEWRQNCDELQKRRYGDRPKQKQYPYPGAPNYIVPIIDDLVNNRVERELNGLLGNKYIANFIPRHTDITQDFSIALAEQFNDVLKKQNCRKKLEIILNNKNTIGLAFAKICRDNMIPAFEPVHPFDVIMDYEAVSFKEPERICHILRLTAKELRERARTKNWQNVEEIIATDEGNDSEFTIEEQRIRSGYQGLCCSPTDSNYYCLWEVYYFDYDEDSHEYTRKCKIMSPDLPELEIAEYDWVYNWWPIIIFQYETNSNYYYDSRGIAHLVVDDQIYASLMKNSKGVYLDFAGRPLFKGKINNTANITFAPGSILPGEIEPIQLPMPPTNFDYDINSSYLSAERRVGSQMAALSQKTNGQLPGKMTATEVQAQTAVAAQSGVDSIERFNEPLEKMFEYIYQWLKEDSMQNPELDQLIKYGVNPQALMMEWIIKPSVNLSTTNPLFYGQQLQMLLPMLAQSGVVKTPEVIKHILETIDPRLPDKIMIDQNSGQAPIEMQIAQLGQMVQQLGITMQKLQPDLQNMKDEIGNQKKSINELIKFGEEVSSQMQPQQAQEYPTNLQEESYVQSI